MARYPALRILYLEPDLALAAVDDFGPVAADEERGAVRIFFAGTEPRDRAAAALRLEHPTSDITPIEVDDEDWARRSQANLPPITVGRLIVTARTTLEHPPSTLDHSPSTLDHPSSTLDHPSSTLDHPSSTLDHPSSTLEHPPSTLEPQPPSPLRLVIRPSLGFGTGHHATTRLCLAALQQVDVAGKVVLDLGSGSGILAIAAAMLGAARAIGIDDDRDAVQAARENLTLNPDAHAVEFISGDLRTASLPRADVVVANLTGAVIASAATILAGAAAEGLLILSGLLLDEELAVRRAFPGSDLTWRATEDEWVALTLNFSSGTTV